MRSSASSIADVWKGFATTSAAPARSASTAPATEPCAVSASAVTAGRQVRAFMITPTPSPAGNPRSTIATEKWPPPSSAMASAALAVWTVSCPIALATLATSTVTVASAPTMRTCFAIS